MRRPAIRDGGQKRGGAQVMRSGHRHPHGDGGHHKGGDVEARLSAADLPDFVHTSEVAVEVCELVHIRHRPPVGLHQRGFHFFSCFKHGRSPVSSTAGPTDDKGLHQLGEQHFGVPTVAGSLLSRHRALPTRCAPRAHCGSGTAHGRRGHPRRSAPHPGCSHWDHRWNGADGDRRG